MTQSNSPIQTASLTLIRSDRGRPEVFWARRRADRSFLGGCFAFFAGGVESSDSELPTTLSAPQNPTSGTEAPGAAPTRNEDVLRATALRECFEECGALFCQNDLILSEVGAPFEGRTLPAPLPTPLATHRLRLVASRRTPSWMMSADTAFFTLHLSDEEALALDALSARLDPSEHDFGQWITPADALAAWSAGEAMVTTPILDLLDLLGLLDAAEDAISPETSLVPQPVADAIEYLGGVTMLPLRTTPLPPATHTNAFLIGRKRFVIVDPGPDDPSDLELLSATIEARITRGDTPTSLVLTHHHRDHIGGAQAIATRFDLPILAHPLSAQLLPELDTLALTQGETLDLGDFGALEVLHTPGHAPGHLALYHRPTRSIFAGDLVASQGTIIIDPPQGHMGDYLESLRTLLAMQPRILWPAHGAPIADPHTLLTYYIDHRIARENAVLAALRDHPDARPEDLIAAVYPEIPSVIWPLAARSLLAHLIHLSEQKLATRSDDDRFSAT